MFIYLFIPAFVSLFGRYFQESCVYNNAGREQGGNYFITLINTLQNILHGCIFANVSARTMWRRRAHLQHVSSDVVLQRPVQCVQDLNDFFLFENGEESVQEDLKADGNGLGPVQHQAADVKHHAGVDDLHLAALVQVGHLQLAQGCQRGK